MSKFRLTSLCVPFLLVCAAAAAEDKPLHFFILSGQSNMAGMNPQLGFVPEAERLFPDAEVAFIKVASGGKPIRMWVEEWNEIAARHKLDSRIEKTTYYQPILEQTRKALGDRRPASVTFCWMQGERDAKEKLSPAYADALRQLVANLRRDLERPDLQFVIGRLSDFGPESNTEWQAVRRAQVEVAETDPRGAWVDCDDLNNKTKRGKEVDDLHYTREGYELLGRRYARQAKALVDGRDPAGNGRPE